MRGLSIQNIFSSHLQKSQSLPKYLNNNPKNMNNNKWPLIPEKKYNFNVPILPLTILLIGYVVIMLIIKYANA